MSAALHQLLLVVALAAAGDAAIRLAGLTGAMGLERVLAAAPLAAAYAVSSALVLGLAGLGGNPWVLTATSIVTWGAARFALPRQSSSLLAEVRSRARSLSARTRVLAWALGGVAVAWTVGIVLRPAIGSDGVVYHLTEIVGWVRSGHPGSVQSITYEFPVGSYPLTHEVLLSWATAISRSFAPAALAGPAFLALGCAALGHALRRLAVPGFLIGLGLAAFASSPIVADQVAGPNTDLPAVVWLAVAGALSLSVAARPAILGPAILAGALAVGTKTTALPLAAVALGLGLWWGRAALRRLAVPLAACAGAGLLAGGLWYVRNLVVHGSPLWPFTSGPWGDPVPALIDKLRFSFIERPVATLHDRLHLYVEMLAGFGPLIAAALVAPFTARGRALRLAGVVSALSLLAWASAPVTGIPDDRQADLTLTTLRYLLPVAAMAIVTVALAGRGGPR
ncbi:MAG: hypothetical protein QOK31_871, partial [Solirubrobacteraceae bacterium]|nr:hypothetical protein [Solirubrobacteraceae bacterium]